MYILQVLWKTKISVAIIMLKW